MDNNQYDFEKDAEFKFTSKWKKMIVPFLFNLLITTVFCIFVASFIVMKLLGESFTSKTSANISVAILVITVVGGWTYCYQFFFPKKWISTVHINLEEEIITIQRQKKEIAYHFKNVEQIRFESLNSLLSASELYFITVDEKESAMLALSDKKLSNDFFFMMKNRAKINMIQ